MDLYIIPMSCSLASRMALYEAGLTADFHLVDLATKQLADGRDYRTVNPAGKVPALVLEDGQVLHEGAAVLQYIADQAPASGLAPPAGTMERLKVQQWLNYVAVEVHRTVFYPVFNPGFPEEARAFARSLAAERYDYLSKHLEGRDHLVGDRFTVADAYLATTLLWPRSAGIDLKPWPVLTAYRDRMTARPAVARAIAEEMALFNQAAS